MIWQLFRHGLRRRPIWLIAGVVLSLTALTAGMLLLALSGWFITASALAGLGLIVALDIFTPGAGIRLAAIVRTVARYSERLVTHDAALRVLADLRVELFQRLLKRPAVVTARLRRGDMLQRLTRDVDSLDQLFIGVVGPTLAVVLATGLALAALAWIDPAMALAAGLLLLSGTGVVVASDRLARQPARHIGKRMPALRMAVGEGIDGRDELLALARTDRQALRIRETSQSLVRLQTRMGQLDAIGQGAVTLAGLIAVWLTLLAGLAALEREAIAGPVLPLAVLGLIGLVEAWQLLPVAWRRMSHCRAAAERLRPLLQADDAGSPDPAPCLWPARSDIEFRHLDFRHGDRAPPLLVNFDLTIAHGESVLLRGASGIGKSTLARLLLGELQPQHGEIRIGGSPLQNIQQDERNRCIACLPQRVVLFADTLAANLRLAAPAATDRQLYAVLERVGLEDLVARMPHGLDSWVAESGHNLSGGQRRRLAMARLLLTEPDLVILDEPTANIDRAGAESLMRGLNDWLGSRTALLISHENWLPADRVVVLEADAAGRLQLGDSTSPNNS